MTLERFAGTDVSPDIKKYLENYKKRTSIQKAAKLERQLFVLQSAPSHMTMRMGGVPLTVSVGGITINKQTKRPSRALMYDGILLAEMNLLENGSVEVMGRIMHPKNGFNVHNPELAKHAARHYLAEKLKKYYDPFSTYLRHNGNMYRVTITEKGTVEVSTFSVPSNTTTIALSRIHDIHSITLPKIPAQLSFSKHLKRFETPEHIRQATKRIAQIEHTHWHGGRRGKPGFRNGVIDTSSEFYQQYAKIRTSRDQKLPQSPTHQRRLHYLYEALQYYKLPRTLIPSIWSHMRRESNFDLGLCNPKSSACGLSQGIWSTRKRFYREVSHLPRFKQLVAMGHPLTTADERIAIYFIVWHFRKSVDRGMNPNGEVWRQYIRYHDGPNGTRCLMQYLQSGLNRLAPGKNIRNLTLAEIKQIFNILPESHDKGGRRSKLNYCNSRFLRYTYQHKLGGHIQRTHWLLNYAGRVQHGAQNKYSHSDWTTLRQQGLMSA